ncbi:MAG: hypothetical protein AB7V27_15480 [Candidatus Binatia bacterium]
MRQLGLPSDAVEDAIPGSADDVLLPSQFFGTTGDPRCEPEKRLMVAVLEEAIASSLAGIGSDDDEQLAIAREAQRWFANEDRSGPFTFCTICDVLGLSSGRVRQLLAVWHQRRLAFRRPRLQAGRGRHQVQGPGRRTRRAA